MTSLSRRVVVVLLSSFILVSCATAPVTDPNYQPSRGQNGKDVMWIATPPALVDKMLTMAQVTPQDRVFDLGAGDGVIAIAAAQQFKAHAVGIEFNPKMAEFARRKVAEAGVQDKVRIVTGDIFKEDFSSASVLTLYLLPELNLQLRPTILRMKPGTRVVAHSFDMGEWQADQTASAAGASAFMWIVPAPVQGSWRVRLEGGQTGQLDLVQTFQNAGGSLTLGGRTVPLLGARLRGEDFSFQFRGEDQSVSSFSGKVIGNRLSGTLSTDGAVQSLDGSRL